MATSGWGWILNAAEAPWRSTSFADTFDGAYLAACPRCGQDCYWNAYDNESTCPCSLDPEP